jgi:Zn-dependent protease with chaperone function
MRSARKPAISSTWTWGCNVISGYYFDGRSAASVAATLEFGAGSVQVLGPAQPVSAPLADVRISDRIANIPRRLQFDDGAVFETDDNESIDRACEAQGIRSRAGFVHWLESRWPVALASMAAVVLLAFGFLRWGVPAITIWAAQTIPAETDAAIGSGTLELLDEYAFYQSSLPDARQEHLRRKFTEMTADLDDGHQYALELRNGGALGANAIALPSGIVVMTDQLVELAESEEELVAVLAHEIGHVRGRHALRQMLQAAGVSAMAMALFGDVSSVSGVLGAAPVLLQAKHSREFESEADVFARQWLREHGIAESRFDAILCRMTAGEGDNRALSFFASHPPTAERANCAKEP